MRVAQPPKQVAGHGMRPTKFWSAAAAVLAATLAAGVLLVNGPHSGKADAATPTWQSGVYVGGCNTTAINQFKTWRGGNIGHGMVFLGTSWSAIQNPTSAASCFKTLNMPVTFSVPMLPASGASIATGATGAYDSYWANLGKNLVVSGQANADLRIGWEMNGTWFNWSAEPNATAWKAYWVHIVKAMRKATGQHFTFTWSPGNGQSVRHRERLPGRRLRRLHRSEPLRPDVRRLDGERGHEVERDPQVGGHGLAWQASFASAHGKKLAYPEWALATPSSFNGHGNGDNTYFIQQFYNFLKGSQRRLRDVLRHRPLAERPHASTAARRRAATSRRPGAMYRRCSPAQALTGDECGGIVEQVSDAPRRATKTSASPTKTTSRPRSPTKTSATAKSDDRATPRPGTPCSTAPSSTGPRRTCSTVRRITGGAAVFITPSATAPRRSASISTTRRRRRRRSAWRRTSRTTSTAPATATPGSILLRAGQGQAHDHGRDPLARRGDQDGDGYVHPLTQVRIVTALQA